MEILYEFTSTLSGKTANLVTLSRMRAEMPFQVRRTREQDGRNTSMKHSTDLHHPSRQTSHHLLNSFPSTPAPYYIYIPRMRSTKPSCHSSQAKQCITWSTESGHPNFNRYATFTSTPDLGARKSTRRPGESHLVKLTKKEDMSSCNNWRGIDPAALYPRESINENYLTETGDDTGQDTSGWTGSLPAREVMHRLHVYRHNAHHYWAVTGVAHSLYSIFQKVLDSVNRDVIWKLIYHYGYPPMFVNTIQQLYDDATC